MRNAVTEFRIGLVSALVALLAWGGVSSGDEVTAPADEWIGATVKPLSAAWRERWDYWRPGVLVTQVVPGGAADRAGIAAGDIIALVGSVTIRDEADLDLARDRAEPGQPVAVTLARNYGRMIKITNLEPAGQPGEEPGSVGDFVAPSDGSADAALPTVPPGPAGDRWTQLGIEGAPLNPDLASALGVPSTAGVLVLQVASDGFAGRVGIRAGDVITSAGGTTVAKLDDVRGALTSATGTLPVHVQRRDREWDVEVSLVAPPTPGAEGQSLQPGQDEATRQQLDALRREIEKLRAELRAMKGEE